MKPTRNYYLKKMFYAFILTNIMFLIIILTSLSVSYLNYNNIKSKNSVILESLNKINQLSILNCDDSVLLKASELLDETGIKINLLEIRFRKDDYRVLEQKSIYTALELKHYELIKKLKTECEKDFVTILFFYSNKKEIQEESEKVGFILSTFKNTAPERIMVYSFDADLESEHIKKIKEKYSIEKTPIVIINEKESIEISNIRDLERYL